MAKRNIFKQSLIMGALTSSFGVFVSKIIGLLYYSPLNSAAGASNMSLYNLSYSYFEILLQVSQAGVPFAISALVAKYYAKNDYKTVLVVKKMGMSIVLALGFISSVVFVLLSDVLAKKFLGSSAPLKDVNDLKTLFYILTSAVMLVPFLSALRGYCQGLKRFEIYASGQVLEQFVRVFTIIIIATATVKVFKLESIWAIYTALGAASFAAIIAFIYTKGFLKKDDEHVRKLASNQDNIAKTNKEIIIELLSLGIPYLIVSILANATMIINTTFFIDYMTEVNGASIYEYAKVSSGVLQANCAKLSGIPMVISTGFCSSMVPYLTELLEKRDNIAIKKQVNQILEAALFTVVPMMLIFFFFAKDIYYIMYGNEELLLGESLLKTACLQYFLGTISAIFSSMMVTLGLKKNTIFVLLIAFILKYIVFFPCVKLFGTYGISYSNAIYDGFLICMYLYFLKKYFEVNINASLKKFVVIAAISCISIVPVFYIYSLVDFEYDSRLLDIAYMGLCGIPMLAIYLYFSFKVDLPKQIFNIKKPDIKDLIARFRS